MENLEAMVVEKLTRTCWTKRKRNDTVLEQIGVARNIKDKILIDLTIHRCT